MHPRPSRRRLRARAVPVLSALTAVLALAACGGPATASAPTAAGGPVPGGTLRFAVGSDQGCVDPQQVGSNDQIYSVRQIVDSLTDQDPETGEIVPWLAPGSTRAAVLRRHPALRGRADGRVRADRRL